MNLPELTVLCGMPSIAFIRLLFFKEMITGLVYFNNLRTLTLPKICQLYGTQKFYSERDVTFELSGVTSLKIFRPISREF